MNQYRDIIGRISYVLFLVIVALLPFPQIYLRYAFVLWFICWVLEGRWLCKPRSLRENKMAIPMILFGLWYAWRLLSFFWAPDHDAWAWQAERYLSFGLIIPVGIWGVNAHYNWRTAGKVLVWSCVAAIFVYIAWVSLFYVHNDWIGRFPNMEYWTNVPKGWFAFFESNISWVKHRLFLCSVELFGAVMAYQLYRKRPAILLPVMLVMLSSIPLTGSRQSILTVVALMAVALVYELPQRYRLRYGVGILLLGIILGFGLLELNPRMQNFDFAEFTQMRNVNSEHNVRLNIWGLALQQPSDYLAHGLGSGQSTNYMIEKYKEANFSYFVDMQYHAHNQYLEELMELGVPGLLFFLLCWLSIPICASRKGVFTALLFTALFMMNMLTDCMFGKFCGIALWAAGLMMIMLQSESDDPGHASLVE